MEFSARAVAREWLLMVGCGVFVLALYTASCVTGNMRQDLSEDQIAWLAFQAFIYVYLFVQFVRVTTWAVRTVRRVPKADS